MTGFLCLICVLLMIKPSSLSVLSQCRQCIGSTGRLCILVPQSHAIMLDSAEPTGDAVSEQSNGLTSFRGKQGLSLNAKSLSYSYSFMSLAG